MIAGAARDRYSAVAMALHWLIALLVLGNLAGGHLAEFLEISADPAQQGIRGSVIAIHKSFGLLIIPLTLARFGWRLANPPPPLPAYMTAFEQWAARSVHICFYLLLFVLPLSGWAMVSTGRSPASLSWFGVFSLPAMPLPASLHGMLRESHELLAWAMAGLVVLHAGAALKHQILDRDNILARMLPRR